MSSEELIKFRVTPKVSKLKYNKKRYYPGDIVYLPRRMLGNACVEPVDPKEAILPIFEGQCEGVTKKGKRCRLPAVKGEKFCATHLKPHKDAIVVRSNDSRGENLPIVKISHEGEKKPGKVVEGETEEAPDDSTEEDAQTPTEETLAEEHPGE